MVLLEQLLQTLVDKPVRISHVSVPTATYTGTCSNVLEAGGNSFIVCLTNGRRFSVTAENVDGTSIEGRIALATRTRRKIELILNEPTGDHMANKPSVAEDAGMLPEVRCERANELLRHWTRFHEIPAGDHGRKEERVMHKNEIFAALSDPLQVNLERLLANPAMLGGVLVLVRAMYGDDATDFALKASERERTGH